MNNKRMYRLWHLLGLSLPPYKPSKKIRTGATLDLQALKRNGIWAWGLVHNSYFRYLTVKNEATGYCLKVEVATSIKNGDVKLLLRLLIARYGAPEAIRSDNGPEFIATELQSAIKDSGIQVARIDPGKPRQNGSNEGFNGTLRRECLDAELFGSLMEAQVVIEKWRQTYNRLRPRSSHRYTTSEMNYFGLQSANENITA